MRVVLVGLGWVATEVWLPRLLSCPDCTVVGAVEPDAGTAARAAPLLEGRTVHADYHDVPLDGMDCAFVLTPNHTHAEIGGWFLEHGRTVVLEKPVCIDRAQLDALAAAAGAGGGRLALSTAPRHRGDVAALRRVVESGELGAPRVAELSWVRARGIPRSGWSTQRASSGGGALMDLGWHLIDLVLDLWGPVRVRGAAACMSDDFIRRDGFGATWRGTDDCPPSGDVEDQLTALVTTDSYALSMRFAWASHESVDETVVTLRGVEGTAELRTTFGFSPRRLDGSALRVKRAGSVRTIEAEPTDVGSEYDRQLAALLTRDHDETTTERSLTTAGGVLDIVNACYSSAGI
ncbi:MAG: Gfo/Idh/MocA family protein [Frankiaceae bacterium]